MKDRNTSVFFLFIGILIILFACLAPLTSSGIIICTILTGAILLLFAAYIFIISHFRVKSAFSIIKETKSSSLSSQQPTFKKNYQALPIKRL